MIAYENGLIILWDILEAQVVVVRGDKVLELRMDASDQPEHNLETQITALCWASSNGAVLAVGYIDEDIMFWKTSNTASSKGRKAGASSNNLLQGNSLSLSCTGLQIVNPKKIVMANCLYMEVMK